MAKTRSKFSVTYSCKEECERGLLEEKIAVRVVNREDLEGEQFDHQL